MTIRTCGLFRQRLAAIRYRDRRRRISQGQCLLRAAEAAATQALALDPSFSARAFVAACGTVPELAEPLADAWR
jgi:hypothetical protein